MRVAAEQPLESAYVAVVSATAAEVRLVPMPPGCVEVDAACVAQAADWAEGDVREAETRADSAFRVFFTRAATDVPPAWASYLARGIQGCVVVVAARSMKHEAAVGLPRAACELLESLVHQQK